MKTLNNGAIMNKEEVGGTVACIMACGGLCLVTGAVGSAFGTAAQVL